MQKRRENKKRKNDEEKTESENKKVKTEPAVPESRDEARINGACVVPYHSVIVLIIRGGSLVEHAVRGAAESEGEGDAPSVEALQSSHYA